MNDSRSPSPLHRALIQGASVRSDVRQAALEEGRQAAIRELSPHVEKIAAAAVARMQEDDRAAEVFRGQVAAHAAAQFLERAKFSMQEGFCWDCGINKFSHTSRARRCDVCDTLDHEAPE